MSKLANVTVAQMREAAAAWRAEDLRHRDNEATRSTYLRITELIDEIARLRDCEVTSVAGSPTLVWRNPALPEGNHHE